jgi:hypothetical protein
MLQTASRNKRDQMLIAVATPHHIIRDNLHPEVQELISFHFFLFYFIWRVSLENQLSSSPSTSTSVSTSTEHCTPVPSEGRYVEMMHVTLRYSTITISIYSSFLTLKYEIKLFICILDWIETKRMM